VWMRPLASAPVPAATAVLARAVFPAGCLAMRLRDELGDVFVNADFTAAYAPRAGLGRRSENRRHTLKSDP
jgi:hypothetical protein